MKLLFVWLNLFLAVLYLCGANDEEGDSMTETPIAKVLTYKYSDTNPIVEGLEFVITYQIINLGNAPATSIEIIDRYDPNSFTTSDAVDDEGVFSYSLDELAPGAQNTFNVSLFPKLFGIYDSTRARVRYSPSMPMDGMEPEYKQGLSTSLGRVRIISAAEHSRNWSFFTLHWAVFALLFIAPTSLSVYYWSKAKETTQLLEEAILKQQ